MRNPLARDLDEVLARTGDLWDELRGARIFLTGGTGFFGCWLLETLLWANRQHVLQASVVVLTRNADAFRRNVPHLASDPSVTLHRGDVCTFDVPAGAFSHVVHAAVNTTEDGDRQAYRREFESTIDGTRHTLEFARRAGARRFLFTSSGSVYGPQPPALVRVPESYTGAPTPSVSSAGAEAKRAAEWLCLLHADRDFEPVTARCFTFVGPYLPIDRKFAVGNFIRDGLRGGPIRVSGDGTPVRSYLYASDLAVWLWTILVRGQSGRAYNVGSEDEISIAGLAESVGRHFEPRRAVSVAGTPVPGAAPTRYVPDTTRARTELGLGVTVDLEGALGRTISWHHLGLARTHVSR